MINFFGRTQSTNSLSVEDPFDIDFNVTRAYTSDSWKKCCLATFNITSQWFDHQKSKWNPIRWVSHRAKKNILDIFKPTSISLMANPWYSIFHDKSQVNIQDLKIESNITEQTSTDKISVQIYAKHQKSMNQNSKLQQISTPKELKAESQAKSNITTLYRISNNRNQMTNSESELKVMLNCQDGLAKEIHPKVQKPVNEVVASATFI